MNWATGIVLVVVLALAVLAFRAIHKQKTGGDCASCDANCPFRKK